MIDTAIVWVRAETALRAGRDREALEYLRQLVEVVDRIEFEYNEWLAAYADCLRRMGSNRQATLCDAYLGRELVTGDREEDARETSPEQARWERTMGILLDRGGEYGRAAEAFTRAGMPVHRAIAHERADDIKAASQSWERLLNDERLAGAPYVRALVQVNYALSLHRLGAEQAGAAVGQAVAAVEAVADAFETEGLRERAFDCFQLIARIGLETDSFENIAEGSLNSIRVLRADGLRIDALRMYHAFVDVADAFGEHHAAATALREASEYCARVGMPYADVFRLRAGEMWRRAADGAATLGMPAQLVENALVSAAENFIGVRAFARTAGVYDQLVAVASSVSARERYQRLRARLGNRPEDEVNPRPTPEHLRQRTEYEETWFVDPAEWETDGDPEMSAAGIIADRRYPDYVRRHALLTALDIQRARGDLDTERLVQRIQSIRAYPMLASLERLYESGDESLQLQVANAIGAFRFKRSFVLISRMLRSSHVGVRTAAEDAVAGLFFPHAHDRLRTLFAARDLPSPETSRLAALRAIGRVNTPEALEFICERLRDGDPRFTEPCRTAIGRLTNPELVPVLRTQMDLVPATYRAVFDATIQRLSGS